MTVHFNASTWGPKSSKWTVLRVSDHSLLDFRAVFFRGSFYFWGPSSLTLLDRPVWPGTVHFGLDPRKLFLSKLNHHSLSLEMSPFRRNIPSMDRLTWTIDSWVWFEYVISARSMTVLGGWPQFKWVNNVPVLLILRFLDLIFCLSNVS